MEDYLEKRTSHFIWWTKTESCYCGALAMNQDVIILDEATSMLDPRGTSDIINLIKKSK